MFITVNVQRNGVEDKNVHRETKKDGAVFIQTQRRLALDGGPWQTWRVDKDKNGAMRCILKLEISVLLNVRESKQPKKNPEDCGRAIVQIMLPWIEMTNTRSLPGLQRCSFELPVRHSSGQWFMRIIFTSDHLVGEEKALAKKIQGAEAGKKPQGNNSNCRKGLHIKNYSPISLPFNIAAVCGCWALESSLLFLFI